MSEPTSGSGAGQDGETGTNAVRLEEVRRAIPALDELRPVLDFLTSASHPDADAAWSGSGELSTVDARVVDSSLLEEKAGALAAAEAAHLGRLFGILGRAVAALGRGGRGECALRLLDAAALEEERERPDRARAYAVAAYELARTAPDQHPAALALRRAARAARALGDLEEALEGYVGSHRMALALGDERGAAEAAVGAGNVVEERGEWSEAEAWYRRALDAIAGNGEAPERWHALLNLHIVTRSQGALEASIPLLEDAAAAASRVDGGAASPFLENARGQLSMSQGAFVDAEAHFREGLLHARGARARVTIGINLAEALLAQGRSLDAAEQARLAERDAIVSGLTTRLPEVYRMLGRIASEEGNADAFVLFERALGIVRDRGLPALEEAVTLQAYAHAEARVGDREAARALRDRAMLLFDELNITHERRAWSDVFGPDSEPVTSLPPKSE